MRSPRIYTPQDLTANSVVELEPEPSAHIARVLRMRVGDSITLFNGRGGDYPCSIASVDKKTVSVDTQSHRAQELESPLRLALGIALSKGDRLDWVIQKATELGVASIAPLVTERTQVKLKGDRAAKKLLHWQKIVIAACEQSGRNQLPELRTIEGVDKWTESLIADRKFVLHHRDSAVEKTAGVPASVAILIGPEGGLTAREIDAAVERGFESLSLGPRILRTETAPLAALAILQAQWGDMASER